MAAKAFPSLNHNLSDQFELQKNTKPQKENNNVRIYFNQDYVKND